MDNESPFAEENQRLRRKLQEAEDLIDAIRNGRIDALVVTRPEDCCVYTLKGADHTYRVLIETMDEGALILSGEETVLYCNRSFAGMLGFSMSRITGSAVTAFIAPKDRERFRELHHRALEEDGARAEIGLTSSGGAVMPALVSLRGLPMEDIQTMCMVVTDLSDQKRAESILKSYSKRLYRQNEELKGRAEQLARLSSELTMAEQRERRRLADLLHDDLQQMLAGARLNLDFVSQEKVPAQHPAFRDACHLLAQSLETSRTLCSELSPPVLYMKGLAEALQWLARWMEKSHKLQVELQIDPQAEVLQEDLKVLLFQSVRELLFNVVKHAGAKDAMVELRRSGDDILIAVGDRGPGFDPHELENKWHTGRGYGLFNIRERLSLLGGHFQLQSSPSTGTTIILKVPVKAWMTRSRPGGMAAAETSEQPLQPEVPPPDRPAKGPVQVLLADDHAVMRQGLSVMLSRYDDIDVVGEAADGGQAVEMARRVNPDIILMDVSMPVIDGIEATRIIHSQIPWIKIIGLSMHDADDQAAAMQEAGAVAYLCKSSRAEAIVSTIRRCSSTGEMSGGATEAVLN